MKPPKPRPKTGKAKTKLRARRSLSQSFLIDRPVAQSIADALGPAPLSGNPWVLEIGCGKGFLTEHLVAAGWQVWGIEKDNRMIGMLKKKFPDTSTVRVNHADILSLPDHLYPPEGCPLVGNLPYGIGSQILAWILRDHARFQFAIIMLQREVANRLVARPGDSARSSASVWFQSHARATTLFNVPPAAFYPPPRVMSTVLRIDFAPLCPLPDVVDRSAYEYIAQTAFANRRKTLENNFKAASGFDGPTRKRLWEMSGVDPKLRAQQLADEDFQRLTVAFQECFPTRSKLINHHSNSSISSHD